MLTTLKPHTTCFTILECLSLLVVTMSNGVANELTEAALQAQEKLERLLLKKRIRNGETNQVLCLVACSLPCLIELLGHGSLQFDKSFHDSCRLNANEGTLTLHRKPLGNY